MTAQIIAFTLYLAAGVAFAVWGVVRGGKKTIAYPILEGVLSALGIAAALVIYFTFGRSPGWAVEKADRLEYVTESFSVFVKFVLIVWGAVAVLAGLRLLLRLLDAKKAGVWGLVLDTSAPFVGATVIFLVAIAAYALIPEFTSVDFEITAFALSAALGLRFSLALGALIGRREEKRQG